MISVFLLALGALLGGLAAVASNYVKDIRLSVFLIIVGCSISITSVAALCLIIANSR
jgi:hypothetical protein